MCWGSALICGGEEQTLLISVPPHSGSLRLELPLQFGLIPGKSGHKHLGFTREGLIPGAFSSVMLTQQWKERKKEKSQRGWQYCPPFGRIIIIKKASKSAVLTFSTPFNFNRALFYHTHRIGKTG